MFKRLIPSGISQRLVINYGLVAVLPVILAVLALAIHISDQVQVASERYRSEALKILSQNNNAIKEASNQELQEITRIVRKKQGDLLNKQTNELAKDQRQHVSQSLGALSENTGNNVKNLQVRASQNLIKNFEDLEKSVHKTRQATTREMTESVEKISQETIKQLVSQSIVQITDQASRQTEKTLKKSVLLLTLIAQQPAVREFRTQESRWILQTLQNREATFLRLSILDQEGNSTLTVSDLPEDARELGTLARETFDMIDSGEPVMNAKTVFYSFQDTLIPLLCVAAPIRRENKPQGAVVAIISLESLSELARNLRFGQSAYAMICTAEGEILAHRDNSQIGKTESQFLSKIKSSEDQEFGYTGELSDEKGGRCLVSAVPLRAMGWTLIFAQPVEEVYAFTKELAQKYEAYGKSFNQTLNQAFANRLSLSQTDFNKELSNFRGQLDEQAQESFDNFQKQTDASFVAQAKQHQRSTAQLLEDQTNRVLEDLQKGMAQKQEDSYATTAEAFAAVSKQMQNSIEQQVVTIVGIGILFVSFCALLGSFVLNRTVVKPLLKLAEASREIAHGNLNHRVPVPLRKDEIQDLSIAFNQMAEALQQSKSQLSQTQSQLVQSAKLASLGTLASGVAHELNQPLAIIRAIAQQNLQTIQQEHDKPLNENEVAMLKEDLELVEKQTARMSKIILHLRTFSRKSSPDFEPVNLNEVAQNALVLLREQLRQRDIELDEQYDDTLPCSPGDANALEQIAINLITNARDALETVENAKLILITRQAHENGSSWTELHVSDNGPGIPAEIFDTIFDPFFTTKDPGKGTGLGLSISLEIAEKHQGKLIATRSEQGGACFILRLPAINQSQAAA